MSSWKAARIALTVCLGIAFAPMASGVHAEEAGVKLFKIVTAKDDVMIGLTDSELKSFGSGPDLDNLAQRLASAGQITVWQYAVKHGDDGNLIQAPLRRVAIFKTDTLRIEPFNPAPLKVMPPAAAKP